MWVRGKMNNAYCTADDISLAKPRTAYTRCGRTLVDFYWVDYPRRDEPTCDECSKVKEPIFKLEIMKISEEVLKAMSLAEDNVELQIEKAYDEHRQARRRVRE